MCRIRHRDVVPSQLRVSVILCLNGHIMQVQPSSWTKLIASPNAIQGVLDSYDGKGCIEKTSVVLQPAGEA